ncbi:hypothetical protein NL676_019602 [Syzygium grande]|nr:hypothetical protein NL676_019602 [Syzygium grande]
MNSEGGSVGRVPRRGKGRRTRGGGRVRVRAVEDLGMDARAVENPTVNVGAAVDPRMEQVIETLREIGNVMGRQAQERATVIAEAAKAAAAAPSSGIEPKPSQLKLNRW